MKVVIIYQRTFEVQKRTIIWSMPNQNRIASAKAAIAALYDKEGGLVTKETFDELVREMTCSVDTLVTLFGKLSPNATINHIFTVEESWDYE